MQHTECIWSASKGDAQSYSIGKLY